MATRLTTLKSKLQTLPNRTATVSSDSWRSGKENSTTRGYGYKWQQARAAYLLKHPFCAYGCASALPTPVRVEVPVIVPCVGEVPQRPAYEFDKLLATATDGEIILALARDWARGRKYEAELEAVITGCDLSGAKAAR